VIFANIIVLVQGDPEDKEVISKKIQDVKRFYIHWVFKIIMKGGRILGYESKMINPHG